MFELAIVALLQELWTEIFGAACVLFGIWLWDRWNSGQAWRKKHFKNRMVLSLNTVSQKEIEEDGKTVTKPSLVLRTLFERQMSDVFRNDFMVDIVTKAIVNTQPGDPLVPISKDDSWHILNAILNQITEQFAGGFIKKDMAPDSINSKWYLFCLTFEMEGEVKTYKPRVMMIEKDALVNFPDHDDFILETSRHTTRVKTLRFLRDEFEKRRYLFMDLELCM